MALRVTLQPTFVLHSRPYRDTSAIVDLFTLSYGRINVIARNARGQHSRFRGLLRPFLPVLTTWSGKTELMNLSAIESNGAPFEFSGRALLSAIYLNELLVRLLHRYDPHPQLFMLYQQTLIDLQQDQQRLRTLRLFEKKLLNELGYGLQLNQETASDSPIQPEQIYFFDPQQGIKKHLGIYQPNSVFTGKSLLALYHETLDDVDDLRAAKQILRLAIENLLGGKPKSRELFAKF